MERVRVVLDFIAVGVVHCSVLSILPKVFAILICFRHVQLETTLGRQHLGGQDHTYRLTESAFSMNYMRFKGFREIWKGTLPSGKSKKGSKGSSGL